MKIHKSTNTHSATETSVSFMAGWNITKEDSVNQYDTLVDSTELQYYYTDIYAELRKYYLSFDLVEALAYFECAVFKKFPELEDIRITFNKLKEVTKGAGIFEYSDDAQEVFDNFEELLDSVGQIYNKIDIVLESVPTEPILDDDEEVDIPDDKRKFEFGSIEKS